MKVLQKNAFTLIELLVIITIIIIITLSSSQLFQNNSQNKQRTDIFLNQIVSKIDTVKNYALVWKWVWTWTIFETPTYRKVVFSTWTLWNKITWFTSSWTVESSYDYLNIYFDKFYSLNKIECKNADLTNVSSVWNIELKIEWSVMNLSWCVSKSQKIIDLEVQFNNFKNKIRINTVNSVVEKK